MIDYPHSHSKQLVRTAGLLVKSKDLEAAAFDGSNPGILLVNLTELGLGGLVWNWFHSFLPNRLFLTGVAGPIRGFSDLFPGAYKAQVQVF